MSMDVKKTYYKNGNVKTEIPYVNGKKTGRATLFYENSFIKAETDYCDDVIHGFVRTYYEDGSLESVETYTNGKRNGDLVLYNRNGNVSYSHNDNDYSNNYDDIYCLYRHL